MKINFRLPNTTLCLVLWYRNDKPNKVLLPTPANNDILRSEMLKRKVGYGEIRSVQPVNQEDIAKCMSGV